MEELRERDEVIDFLNELNWDIEGKSREEAAIRFLLHVSNEISVEIRSSVYLYAPHREVLGKCLPFTRTESAKTETHPVLKSTLQQVEVKTTFIYLAPQLEEHGIDPIVGILAHEVAHHYVGILGQKSEDSAWRLVEQWGFQKEVEAAREELSPEDGV